MLNGIASVRLTRTATGAGAFTATGGGDGAVVTFALFAGGETGGVSATGGGVTLGLAVATVVFLVSAGVAGIFFGSRIASITGPGTPALLKRITSADVSTKSVFVTRIWLRITLTGTLEATISMMLSLFRTASAGGVSTGVGTATGGAGTGTGTSTATGAATAAGAGAA